MIEAAGNQATRYSYTLDLASLSDQANNIAAKLKSDGITTVVLATDPLHPAAAHLAAQPAELLPGVGRHRDGADRPRHRRPVLRPVAVAARLRAQLLGEQQPSGASYAYAAVKSVDPDHEPIFGVELFYYFFYMVATGVQMAGPNLTPETFAAGHAGLPGRHRPGRHLGLTRRASSPPTGTPARSGGTPTAPSVLNGAAGALRLRRQALQAGQVAQGPARRAARGPGEGPRRA